MSIAHHLQTVLHSPLCERSTSQFTEPSLYILAHGSSQQTQDGAYLTEEGSDSLRNNRDNSLQPLAELFARVPEARC